MRKLRGTMDEWCAHKAPLTMLLPLALLIFTAMFILLLGLPLLDVIERFSSLG
jgi:hypothetical protein